VYLTAAAPSDTTIAYAVVGGTGALDAAAFGSAFPAGAVTIGAGRTTGQFTITIPAGGLGQIATQNLNVQITGPTGVPVFDGTAQTTITQPIAGPPPVPVLTHLTNLGTFSHDGNHY